MSKPNRTLEERIEEKERLLSETMAKMKAYQSQMKALQAQRKDQERRARTRRLIEIGAAVESVVGGQIDAARIPLLLDFLEAQERNGHLFSQSLGLPPKASTQANEVQASNAGNGDESYQQPQY